MSLLSPTLSRQSRVHCLVDEEADHNMLQDLQLAAELGKTLLERNKELESTIRVQQNTIDEQSHEIEYMKKQTTALREVNDSRLRIYEQLEISIQDLERANHLLLVENANDKKLIKSQSVTIENLEIRCEELQKKLDDLESRYQALLRKQEATNEELQRRNVWGKSSSHDASTHQGVNKGTETTISETDRKVIKEEQSNSAMTSDDEVAGLLKQLSDVRNQRLRDQKKISELENQIASLIHENNAIEEQLSVWRNKAEDVKNLQDELNTLEEVRQGHLCGRCLRGINMKTHEELSLMISRNGDDIQEDEDISFVGSFVNQSSIENIDPFVQDTSFGFGVIEEKSCSRDPCNLFVENYKSLMDEKNFSVPRPINPIPNTCMSLQEELRMSGEFNCFQNIHQDEKNPNEKSCQKSQRSRRNPFSGTPTDFSEAETLSSGFSDETCNKSTQTDGRPGSLLCSIADDDNCKLSIYDDNCKLSIYDDNCTFESRFNKTPEYRKIFTEILENLKRSAEVTKNEEAAQESAASGINDSRDSSNLSSQNYNSENNDDVESEMADTDTLSVTSMTVSSVVSEPVFRVHTPIFDRRGKQFPDNQKSNQVPLRPLHKHQQLDYLSIQTRKKSTKKITPKKSSNLNTPKTPDVVPSTNPRVNNCKSSSGRKKFRPITDADFNDGVWNGHTTHFYPSKSRDRRTNNIVNWSQQQQQQQQQQQNINTDYKDYRPSEASEKIAKLKQLDMSYAEVLRMPNKPRGSHVKRS